MKTYRTRIGYLRTNSKERREFVELLSTLPSITRKGCWHWQCGCGGFDMVEYKERIYCNTCGKLRSAMTGRGTVYYAKEAITDCDYCVRPHKNSGSLI